MSRRPLPARSKAVDRFGAALFAALGLSAAACQEPLTAEDPIIPGALYDTSGVTRPDADTSPTDPDAPTDAPTDADPDADPDAAPDADTTPPQTRCTTSIPITYADNQTPTGYAYCFDGAGYMHRPQALACEGSGRAGARCLSDTPGSCSIDLDCGPGAFCDVPYWGGGCECIPSCRQDSDCGEGSVCVCDIEMIGQCVSATCTQDSDCGPNNLCIQIEDCGGWKRFVCQTPNDGCASSLDCGPNPDPWSGPFCVDRMSSDGSLQCIDFCGAGRPFIVEAEARLAPAQARADWSQAGLQPATASLTDDDRATLTAHWVAIGLMEHASVAAFARSAMQLMALGAPPALLIDTQAAMADETQHARAAFALASAYNGQPIGPGPLRMDGALDGGDLEAVLFNTVHEGCIGETVAAVEAAEAAERVTDPVVRAVLLQISADEGRHAALAWRTLQWAMSAFPHARGFIAATLRDAVGAASAPVEVTPADTARAALGVVGGSLSANLRQQALTRVIRPCAARILAQHAEAPAQDARA